MCDVPLHIIPFTTEYWDRVVSHSLEEIKAGRTPNPDIMCNSRIKFGAFYDALDKSFGEFDRVASGHYAKILRSSREVPKLCLTPDPIKDQTYFLANLTQHQLSRALFPLGECVVLSYCSSASFHGTNINTQYATLPGTVGFIFAL